MVYNGWTWDDYDLYKAVRGDTWDDIAVQAYGDGKDKATRESGWPGRARCYGDMPRRVASVSCSTFDRLSPARSAA